MSVVPQGLNTAAKAVAAPTNNRIVNGMKANTPLKCLPRSGVMFAETHPISVPAASPFLIRRVAVKDVKE